MVDAVDILPDVLTLLEDIFFEEDEVLDAWRDVKAVEILFDVLKLLEEVLLDVEEVLGG